MKAERWHEIERLYHEALEREAPERAAFLQRACGRDQPLREEVESLLACRDQAGAFLEVPAAGLHGSNDAAARVESGAAAWMRGFVRREPWWVWCCSLAMLVAAGGMYFVIFAAPQPAGWRLNPVKDAGRAVAYRVIGVEVGTPAERAGFQSGDLVSIAEVERFAAEQQAGRSSRFDVIHAGIRQTRTLTLGRKNWSYWSGSAGLQRLTLILDAALYLGLAAILLFTRPRDRAARWGALLFDQIGFWMLSLACFVRFAPETAYAIRSLPLAFAMPILVALSVASAMPAGAFGLCAVFPRPLPLSNHRWWPWWLIVVGLLATTCADLEFIWLPVYAGPGRPDIPRVAAAGAVALGVLFVAWALALLARNYRRIESPSERRRLRLVAAGLGISLSIQAVNMLFLAPSSPVEAWRFARSFLLLTAALLMAYAILRHRVFDIRVIVRLGVRYAVARGALLSIAPTGVVVLVLDALTHREQRLTEIAGQRGWLYIGLAFAGLLLHRKRKTWLDRLDRRFFRERYDAQRLLRTVVEDVRASANFDETAPQVIARIDGALHPESATLMLRRPGEAAYRTVAATGGVVPPIPAGARLVEVARVLGRPLENSQSATGWLEQQLPVHEIGVLRRARVEWLFPVSLRGNGPQAFLLLGPKRSEEPYSREDCELLEAVAGSLGLLLDRPPTARPVAAGFVECSSCGTCYDSGTARCADDDGMLVKSPYSRTLAGRYRFDRRVGRGGMGSVYRALDTELRRQVAVKVIRPDLIASPDAVARFRREARTAANLAHPNIVTVHHFGIADDDRAYLVMELLEGHSVRDELRARGAVEPLRLLEIMRGAGAGTALAHQQGLVHRDLKPENIFLARSERGEVPKVLDFGLVKPLDPAAADSLAGTASGAVVGTLAYMSPEQLHGETPVEGWDVWALSVVAFEMLTGMHPFARQGDARGTIAGVPEPVAFDASTLAESARRFFERAFAADCSLRPASVGQLIQELEAVLQPARD
jgi:hypothetical protein